MSKYVITAANSFIGRRLCYELSQKGNFVYGVVREKFENNSLFDGWDNFKLIRCDMEHYDSLCDLIEDRVDTGVLLAWNGTRGEQRNDKLRQLNNYVFSKTCVDMFLKMGASTIMTAGSQAEYGPVSETEKIDEKKECNPNTEYGKQKYALYRYTKDRCAEMHARFIEPRFFSLYGEDDFEGTLIIAMITKMLNGEPCELTQCTQMWDFLYVDDAVDALVKLLESEKACGIYNFGSGKSKPLKEYVEEMAQITGTKSKLLYGAVSYPLTGIVHTNPNIERLLSEIDWFPKVSFEDGIMSVIENRKAIVCRQTPQR